MLVKVHSYYSTTFVPGQFTPDSWDVPNGYAETGVTYSIIVSDGFEVTNFSAETHTDFSFLDIVPTEIDKELYLESNPAFFVGLTSETNIDTDQYLSGIQFMVGLTQETDIDSSGLFSPILLEVLNSQSTDIDMFQYLTGDSSFFSTGEVHLRSKKIITNEQSDMIQPSEVTFKRTFQSDLPEVIEPVYIKSEKTYETSGLPLTTFVELNSASKPYN